MVETWHTSDRQLGQQLQSLEPKLELVETALLLLDAAQSHGPSVKAGALAEEQVALGQELVLVAERQKRCH